VSDFPGSELFSINAIRQEECEKEQQGHGENEMEDMKAGK
jgi:hypothetical protein